MRFAIGVLTAALVWVPAVQAQQTVTLGTYGAWRGYTGRANGGERLCGISGISTMSRSLHLKYYEGGDGNLVVQIFNQRWNIPDRTPVRVFLNIDNSSPWNAEAGGFGNMLEFYIGDNSEEFFRRMRDGRLLTVSFPDGNEPPLPISLIGSAAAMNAFVHCVGTLTGRSTQPQRQPTQPHAAPRTSPASPTSPTVPVDRPKGFLAE